MNMDFAEGELLRKERFLGNTHLDSPLQYGNQRKALRLLPGGRRFLFQEWKIIQEHFNAYMKPDQLDFNGLMNHLEQKSLPNIPLNLQKLLRLQVKCMEKNVDIQKDMVSKLSSSEEVQWSGLKNSTDPKLQRYFFLKQIFGVGAILSASGPVSTKFKEEARKNPAYQWWNHLGKGVYSFELYGFHMAVGPNLSFFQWPTGEYWLADRNHFIMISDLLSQRFLLQLVALIASENDLLNYPTVEDLSFVYEWGDKLIDNLGNSGFQLVSLWESLCLGVLMEQTPDPICDNRKFLLRMSQEFCEAPVDMDNKHEYLQVMLTFLRGKFYEHPHKISQLYGLFRIWGHPTINGVTAAAKLQSSACKHRAINYVVIDKILCKFKEKFCLNYYKKHKTWPSLLIEEHSTGYLCSQIQLNRRVDIRHKDYELMDWSYISSDVTFSIDPKFNLGELISDKALSHVKTLLEYEINLGSIGRSEDRAVLVQWLHSTLQDPIAFLLDVDLNGFSEEDQVTGAYPKEQENKAEARLFGLLTLRKRMYVVLTEALIAEYILKYFPEITMMDDEITLIKKMHQATDSKRSKNRGITKSVHLSFDFQKWNSNMRKEETLGIFHFIDGLFGFSNCIARTHEMFHPGFIYIADSVILPELNDEGHLKTSSICWDNHYGGIEGLRQKGWTLFTIILIELCADELDLSYELMGQGDNQVLKLNFSSDLTDPYIKHRVAEFLRQFDKLLETIGPPLKLEETWSSSNLYVYGKYIILNGTPLPMSLKRICKMTSLSNEGIPTLESALSSITANASAALSRDTNLLLIFSIYSFSLAETYNSHLDFSPTCKSGLHNTMRREYLKFRIPKQARSTEVKCLPMPILKPFVTNWNSDYIIALMLFTRALGGYPIQLLNMFLTRGFPDPVTNSIAGIKQIYPKTQGNLRIMIENIMSGDLDSEVRPIMLCQDPTSINWIHPSGPGEQIKRTIFNALPTFQWIRNPVFKNYLESASQDQTELANYLYLMDPLMPRLCKEVLAATVVGSSYDSISRITKTNTMVKILNNENIALRSLVVKSEKNYYNSVQVRLLMRGSHIWEPDLCATWLADYWRTTGWGKQVIGSTVAAPIEAFKGTVTNGEQCFMHQEIPNNQGYILAKTIDGFQEGKQEGWPFCGPILPYLGSNTVEKVQSHGKMMAANVPNMAKTALKLQNTIGWICERGSNLANLLQSLLSAISDIDPNLLAPPKESISGSAVHRFQDRSTTHGGSLPILFTPATYIYLSTNSLVEYAKGTTNVNLHFQALLCSIITSINEVPGSINNSAISYHIHTDCVRCITAIYDGLLDIKVAPTKVLIPREPEQSWNFFPEIKNLLKDGKIIPIITPLDIDDSPGLIANRFHNFLSFDCITQMTSELNKIISRKMLSTKNQTSDIDHYSRLPVGLSFKVNMKKLLPYLLLRIIGLFSLERDVSHSLISNIFLKKLDERLRNLPVSVFLPLTSLFSDKGRVYELTQSPYFVIPILEPFYTEIHLATMCKQAILQLFNSWLQSEHPSSLIPKINITREGSRIDQHPLFLHLIRKALIDQIEGRYCSLEDREMVYELILTLSSPSYREMGYRTPLSELIPYHKLSRNIRHQLEFTPLIQQLLLFQYGYSEESVDYIGKLMPTESLQLSENISKIKFDLPNAVHSLAIVRRENLSITKQRVRLKIPNFSDVPENHKIDYTRSEMTSTFPTTASYKLLSVLNYLKPDLDDHPIANLGDGAGGFTLTCLRSFLSNNCFFNTKMDIGDYPSHSITAYVPPALIPFPNLQQRLIRTDLTTEIKNNLSDPNYSYWLSSIIPRFSLITCDAEGNLDDLSVEVKIAHQVFTLGLLTQAEFLIHKSYLSSQQVFSIILTMACNIYAQVNVMRSIFSTKGNSEVYLVCRGLNNTTYNHPTIEWISRNVLELEGYIPSDQILQRLRMDRIDWQVQELEITGMYTRSLLSPWTSIATAASLTLFLDHLNLTLGSEYKFPEDFWKDMNVRRQPGRYGGLKRSTNLLITTMSTIYLRKIAISYLACLYLVDSQYSNLAESSASYLYVYKTYEKGWGFCVAEVNTESMRKGDLKIPIRQLLQNHQYLAVLRLLMMQKDRIKITKTKSLKMNGTMDSIFQKNKYISSHDRTGIGLKYLPVDKQLHKDLFHGFPEGVKLNTSRIFSHALPGIKTGNLTVLNRRVFT
uniref:Replicase n=1 Tax=Hemipteran rhabdo-related virus OKIAV30 TaxID=2746291 RepID=A0A7D7F2E0_9RHAB|nr:RNA-dependent RNA polymerase [Hemipteran rhabdo-related virus OKIAV30]